MKGLAVGDIPSHARNEVLNTATHFMYEQLKSLVATLNPNGLLEGLAALHETLVHEVENTRLTIPTRLSCFSSHAKMVTRIGKELPDRYKASVALRFLIEYVAAQPPTGTRQMTMEVYDRLLTLSSEIVGLGQMSDAVRYEIAAISVSILPSGRLGIGRDGFDEARQSFLPVQAHGEIGRASRSFSRHWESSGA